jgi:hypothetical protein
MGDASEPRASVDLNEAPLTLSDRTKKIGSIAWQASKKQCGKQTLALQYGGRPPIDRDIDGRPFRGDRAKSEIGHDMNLRGSRAAAY